MATLNEYKLETLTEENENTGVVYRLSYYKYGKW
jgi:hypothetical protein